MGIAALTCLSSQAQTEVEKLPQLVVEGSRNSQLGIAESASQGVVTQSQLKARTVYRPGELLEATPGLVVSQHSGEGKANQYYLRGFNLDHGTDLRTTIDGMLVNQRSHAHGQGWTDLNFMIPELAARLDYKKGPFFASQGDFSSAGAVSVVYADKLDAGIASLSLGQNRYARTLLAASPAVAGGNLLYALELFHNDGPFTKGDNFRKFNGVLRYSAGDSSNGYNLTAMAYKAKWNATDQIPLRAVTSGQLGRFDSIDPSDGGAAQRISLSGAWRKTTENAAWRANAYLVAQRLDLYSNFTYFNDDPVNGDQFSQPDRRVTSGLDASYAWQMAGIGKGSETTVGLQLQNDNIFNGLHSTVARQRVATTRQDHIVQSSAGIYIENTTRWSDSVRTTAGLRSDFYRFKVESDNPINSGKARESITNPKLGIALGPWQKTELYANIGGGFHSNDARGTTIRIDPKTRDPVDRVSALARARGLELGVRSEVVPGLQSTLSFYRLDLASELLFVGDAGTTAAGRPSRRVGFELSNYYRVNRWLTIDADLAFARARFKNADIAGNRIPGAVEGVASLALAVDNAGLGTASGSGNWFGALQYRYFGARPLLEDNSVRSRSTATLNGRIGYKFSPTLRVELEGFNLSNRRDSAIDYYYESRLRSEAAAVADIHFHPIESRSFRFNVTANF